MRYHNITKNDMVNGEGLRVVLWVAGCEHHCKNCHNPITWNEKDGLIVDQDVVNELIDELDQEQISGITFSGGDPLALYNRNYIKKLICIIKLTFGSSKSIWLYTGYLWEDIKDIEWLDAVDVICDGKYIEELKNPDLHWVGSSNQRIIDVKKSLKNNSVVLYESNSTVN